MNEGWQEQDEDKKGGAGAERIIFSFIKCDAYVSQLDTFLSICDLFASNQKKVQRGKRGGAGERYNRDAGIKGDCICRMPSEA